jgi:hypothetical protein
MVRSLALAVLVTSAAACSPDDGIALSDYNSVALAARCDYYVRCGSFPDADACRAYFERDAIDSPNIEAAIAAGKTRYDGAAAADCFASLDLASCDQTTRSARIPDPSCKRIFVGTGKQGDSCGFSTECESNVCLIPDCPDACCLGQCGAPRPDAALGESCAQSGCVDDAYCATADSICKPLLPAGASCTLPSECDYGMSCVLTEANGPVCMRLPHVGEPCPDGACAEMGVMCSSSRMCIPAGLPGDPCTAATDCSTFYGCNTATLQCSPLPSRGEACTFNCGDDSWCNSGTCDAPKPNGATCQRNNECITNYCLFGTCMDVPLCI